MLRESLSSKLSAMPRSSAPRRIALALEVTTPVPTLRDGDGKLRDTLKYEVLVVDQKKARVRSMGGLEGRLTLSPSGRPEDAPPSVAYQVGESVDVPPGRYELRVSATSTVTLGGTALKMGRDVLPDAVTAARTSAVISRSWLRANVFTWNSVMTASGLAG